MAIIMNGNAVASKIFEVAKAEVAALKKPLTLAVVSVGANPASEAFMKRKRDVAESLGIGFKRYEYESSISTGELRKRLSAIVHDAKPTGIVVQLPLPEHLNTQHILNAVPPEMDADLLSSRAMGAFAAGQSKIEPPIVGAVRSLLEAHKIDYRSKYTVLMGAGRLVGKPLASWLLLEKATFSVVEERIINPEAFTKSADIIISGVGKPGLISGAMIKPSAVVIDAGTSEVNGKISGDVERDSVEPVAGYLSPVPGGVGPVTIAILFKNLITLAKAKKR